MPKYVSFFSFTPQAWARMIDNPGERESAVRTLVESMGGSLEAYYWMFGEYDGFVIIEVPDSITAAGTAVGVASTGALDQVRTHELISAEEAGAVLDKAAQALGHYAPPGEQDR